jgi:hypothetical protein
MIGMDADMKRAFMRFLERATELVELKIAAQKRDDALSDELLSAIEKGSKEEVKPL